MKKPSRSFDQFLFAFAWISLVWTLINILLIALNWQEVFINRESITVVEIFLLLGFISILLFDLLMIFWSLVNKLQEESVPMQINYLLFGGICCLFLLVMVKVMADEIGRESRFGLGSVGEYFVLNIILFIQIAYNVYFLRIMKKNKFKQNKKLL